MQVKLIEFGSHTIKIATVHGSKEYIELTTMPLHFRRIKEAAYRIHGNQPDVKHVAEAPGCLSIASARNLRLDLTTASDRAKVVECLECRGRGYVGDGNHTCHQYWVRIPGEKHIVAVLPFDYKSSTTHKTTAVLGRPDSDLIGMKTINGYADNLSGKKQIAIRYEDICIEPIDALEAWSSVHADVKRGLDDETFGIVARWMTRALLAHIENPPPWPPPEDMAKCICQASYSNVTLPHDVIIAIQYDEVLACVKYIAMTVERTLDIIDKHGLIARRSDGPLQRTKSEWKQAIRTATLVPTSAMEKLKVKNGLVYGLVDDSIDKHAVKIGYTTQSVCDRIKGLQTGNSRKLRCIGTMQGGPELERAFHKLLESSRTDGGTEWFGVTPAQFEKLKSFVEAVQCDTERRVREIQRSTHESCCCSPSCPRLSDGSRASQSPSTSSASVRVASLR